MSAVEIARSLLVSTGHIPHHLAQAMDAVGQRLPPRAPPTPEQQQLVEWVAFDNITYGYLIWVPEADDDNARFGPPELLPLYALARQHQCEWLKLDCDAEVQPDDLPTFNW